MARKKTQKKGTHLYGIYFEAHYVNSRLLAKIVKKFGRSTVKAENLIEATLRIIDELKFNLSPQDQDQIYNFRVTELDE